MSSSPKLRRIVVVGSRSVGKSSLTIQFVENHFAENYYPTIENTFNKIIKWEGQEFSLEIMDTAGQDEYSLLNSRHAIGVHGYVFVYSITSKSSFDMIRLIRDKILNFGYTDNVPAVLVGNKSDLNIQRQVSLEEGQLLANEWKCSFTEASAKHNEGVTTIFNLMITETEKHNQPPSDDKGGCTIS